MSQFRQWEDGLQEMLHGQQETVREERRAGGWRKVYKTRSSIPSGSGR